MAPLELSFIDWGSRTTLAYPALAASGRGEVKMLEVDEISTGYEYVRVLRPLKGS